jgi:hypothetical protein
MCAIRPYLPRLKCTFRNGPGRGGLERSSTRMRPRFDDSKYALWRKGSRVCEKYQERI